MKKTILLLLLCAFIPVSGGCGYSTKSMLPAGMDTIHVGNFSNEVDPASEVSDRRANFAYRPGLEVDITRAVITGFIRDRHIMIESEKKAKMLLKGSLEDYRFFPLSYDKGDGVVELRIEIVVNLELVDNATGKLMWQQKGFMGQTTYSLTGPNSVTEGEATRRAVNDLADRIVELVVEPW